MKPTKKRKMKKDEPEATATETQNGRYAVRARTFRLRLDKEQRRTLSNWMGGARYTYNAALAAIKRKDIKFSDGISALQRRFVGGKQNARTSGAPDPRVGELVAQKPWLKQTPSAIRTANALCIKPINGGGRHPQVGHTIPQSSVSETRTACRRRLQPRWMRTSTYAALVEYATRICRMHGSH
ncbi:hypothetical protein RI054_18g84230 [Pseudoscourfieldia marina]